MGRRYVYKIEDSLEKKSTILIIGDTFNRSRFNEKSGSKKKYHISTLISTVFALHGIGLDL